MDKWQELKLLIDGHMAWPVIYSHSREFEKGELMRVKEWMEYLEKKESDYIKNHAQIMAVKEENKEEGFLFTSIPTFDQKTWERILEEKSLQGLS
jgi:hypothetical protein